MSKDGKTGAEEVTRQTFVVSVEKLKKFRIICVQEDKEQKEALDEALGNFIAAYEGKHGKIKLTSPSK